MHGGDRRIGQRVGAQSVVLQQVAGQFVRIGIEFAFDQVFGDGRLAVAGVEPVVAGQQFGRQADLQLRRGLVAVPIGDLVGEDLLGIGFNVVGLGGHAVGEVTVGPDQERAVLAFDLGVAVGGDRLLVDRGNGRGVAALVVVFQDVALLRCRHGIFQQVRQFIAVGRDGDVLRIRVGRIDLAVHLVLAGNHGVEFIELDPEGARLAEAEGLDREIRDRIVVEVFQRRELGIFRVVAAFVLAVADVEDQVGAALVGRIAEELGRRA